MLIALAQTEDLDDVEALLVDVCGWLSDRGLAEQWPEPVPRRILMERIEQQRLYVAKSNDEVIGTFTLVCSDPDVWDDVPDDGGFVHTLATRPALRGQNIGTALLNEAASLVERTGRRYLRLDCWAPNQRLCQYYEQAGFQSRGIRTFSNGFSLHRYEREVIRPKSSD